MSYVHDVEGVEQETVEITVRLGRTGFERLTTGSVTVSEVWLTKQPDGTYALGVVTPKHPSELGYQARAVETDDRRERFGPHRREPEPCEIGDPGIPEEDGPDLHTEQEWADLQADTSAGASAPETEA